MTTYLVLTKTLKKMILAGPNYALMFKDAYAMLNALHIILQPSAKNLDALEEVVKKFESKTQEIMRFIFDGRVAELFYRSPDVSAPDSCKNNPKWCKYEKDMRTANAERAVEAMRALRILRHIIQLDAKSAAKIATASDNNFMLTSDVPDAVKYLRIIILAKLVASIRRGCILKMRPESIGMVYFTAVKEAS